MKTLIVGGHTRNIGKTSLVVDLIRAFPEAAWTAVKITQYGHGVCSINGERCGCAPDEHTFSLDEERDRSDRTDTSRFLLAGAAHSFWLRAKQGRLAEALPDYQRAVAGAGHVIVESNTLLQFVRPNLYLVVLDPALEDFKDSARRFLDRADACVMRRPLAEAGGEPAEWVAGLKSLVERRLLFEQPLGEPLPADLIALVLQRFLNS